MARKTLLVLASIFMLLLATPSSLGDSILYSGETLQAGESLSLGPYSLIIQEDCNLVLYDSGNPVWATNTGGVARGCHLTLGSDGNLAVYSRSNKVIWSSKSGVGNGNYVLMVQKDRNVVIYGGAIWNTVTYTANGALPAWIYSTNTATTTGAAAVI